MKSSSLYWAELNNELVAGVGMGGRKQNCEPGCRLSECGCLRLEFSRPRGPEISGGPSTFE